MRQQPAGSLTRSARPWCGLDSQGQEAPEGEPSWDGVLLLDVHREQTVTHLSLLEAAALPPFPLSPQLTALSALLSPHFLQGQGGPGSVEDLRCTSNRGDLVTGAHLAIFLSKGKKPAAAQSKK